MVDVDEARSAASARAGTKDMLAADRRNRVKMTLKQYIQDSS